MPTVRQSARTGKLSSVRPVTGSLVAIVGSSSGPRLGIAFILPGRTGRRMARVFQRHRVTGGTGTRTTTRSQLTTQTLHGRELACQRVKTLLKISCRQTFRLIGNGAGRGAATSRSPRPAARSHSPHARRTAPLSAPIST